MDYEAWGDVVPRGYSKTVSFVQLICFKTILVHTIS